MNIYLMRDSGEAGPFSWIEIFIMLRKGELEDLDLARIEGRSGWKSIEAHGFWQDGTEAGPFTWDDIITMLKEGCLDYRVLARIEGNPDLNTLEEVVKKSEEVTFFDELIENSFPLVPEILPAATSETEIPSTRNRKTRILAVVSALVIIIFSCAGILIGWATLGWRHMPTQTAEVAKETNAENPIAVVQTTIPIPAPVTAKTPVEPPKNIVHSPTIAVAPVVSQAPLSLEDAVQSTSESHALPAPSIEGKPSPTATPTKAASLSSPRSSPTSTPVQTVTYTSDFFAVPSVKFLKKEPKDTVGVWTFKQIGTAASKRMMPDQFQPCLEVQVTTRENTRSDQTTAKVYFFDDSNKLLASAPKPSQAGKKSDRSQFDMPVIFYKDKPDRLFFEIPSGIRDKRWKAVVVFGDKFEAKSACYPATESDFLLDYPEKKLVYDNTAKRIVRKPAIDPLVEYPIKTRNPKMPQITLFLRPPKGISDGSEIKGVMAICVLANGLDTVRRELRKEEMEGDYNGLFSFANQNKLAIIAWGAKQLWDPHMNYEDLPREKAREIDESLDTVANAWERGIHDLAGKYGIPEKDYLLWGSCGSAQWAHRLCLRKPEYFLAIDIHIPGSFDKPTPEASKVLWCLSTGELYAGYERSKRFVAACRQLGYPMVFKAIVGLGHAGHPDATALGFAFFKFALTQKELRDQYDKESESRIDGLQKTSEKPRPWPDIFQHPPYYGDMVNQEIYSADQANMVPAGFRIPLPTKEIADIWARSK